MNYTLNFPLKLQVNGFEFQYRHEDHEIHFEIWTKGYIEVMIDHTFKKVSVYVEVENDIKLSKFKQLEQLDNLINR